jgi:hypothetical protein
MSLSLGTFMAQLLTECNGSLPILQDNAKITSFQKQSVEHKRRKPATLSSKMDCSVPACSMEAPRLPSRSSDSLCLPFDCGHKKVSRQPRTIVDLESKPLSIGPSSADRLRMKSWKKSPAKVHRVTRWACAA